MKDRGATWLLVVLLLAQFLFLSRQASRQEPAASPVERAVLLVAAPLARTVTSADRWVEDVGARWRTRGSLQRENEALHERVAGLERDLLRLQSLEGDFHRLARALRYSRSAERDLRMVDVVHVDHSSRLRSAIIYAEEGAVVRNQPVVSPQGLVGRVVMTTGPFAKVQLVTDRASGVGGMIERTRRQGVIRGIGSDRLELVYVPLQAEVLVGDLVLTSGIDGIYPRGIPIGVVTALEPGSQLFHRIEVAPLVELGLLDHAYLLASSPVPEELRGDDAVP